MTLPANGPRPPYLMAADQLRQEIRTGRLKPGDRLPSSRELVESLGIANATVHAALRVLRDEGLIYSVQGRGTYVADQPSTPAATEATARGEEAMRNSAGDEPTDAIALLLTLREQVREMNAALSNLKKRVDDLEKKVERQSSE